jgi:hypothetical protein
MSELSPRTSPTALFRIVEQIKNRLSAVEARPLAAAAPVTATTEQLSASWNDPVAKTYWLINRTDRAYTIKRISAQLTSGTCTAQLVTSAGNLGSAISCSTSQATSVVSLAIPAGDFLKVTLTSVVSAADLCITLDYE